MPDVQTFRDRIPIVARMIERAFNGDNSEGSAEVRFILIASMSDDDERTITSMMSNVDELHTVVSLLLTAMAGVQGKEPTSVPYDDDEQPVGHA